MSRIPRLLITLSLILVGAVHADDIATLPLGDPSRAYLLGSGEAGQIIDCRLPADTADPRAKKAMTVELDALAADLASCDVAIIGEHHTNLGGHQMQWKILDAIAKTGRPFALGMEFFEVTDDEALAAYANGTDDLARMIDRTGWYEGGSFNFEYYRPLVETCRAHKAPIYGLNIPRDWVRTVSRQGTDALPADERKYVGELGPIDERHKYIVNQMMGGLGAAMPEMFDGMYRGQTTWDAAMATSILRAHRLSAESGMPRTIVVIVGSGHMGHGLGIPERLHAMDPSLKVRTLGPVQASKPDEDEQVHPGFERKETAVFSRGYADYVYILPDDGNYEEYPSIGVRFEAAKDSGTHADAPLTIAGVTPGSIGARAGLRRGDAVVRIGSDRPATAKEAGAVLGALRWNDRVEWRVERPGAEGELVVPMLVVAPTDRPEDWLKSAPASELLDSFEPASDRSYLQQKKLTPEAACARLVKFRDKASRIDVLREGVLMESWQLDAGGRPVLGLLSRPALDGAVRVVIERDTEGKATSVKRLDASGKAITSPAPDPHADMTK